MRAKRVGVALFAAVALAALLAGVPLLLVAGLGNPLPDWTALRAGNLSDTMLLQLLGCVLWLAWAQWVPGTLLEISAGIRDARSQRAPHSPHPVREPRHISAGQAISRTLVTAIIGLIIATPITINATRAWAAPAANSPTGGAPASRVTATAPALPATLAAARSDTTTPAAADHRTLAHPRYIVGSNPAIGPSVWSIAEHTLHDPLRWREIWDLNKGHTMADGSVFTDADDIHDGWQLQLPEDAAVPATPHTGPGTEVTVEPDETVDGIAADLHTDPQKLIDANLGRSEPGGRTFNDPDLILPGWKLRTGLAAPAATPGHTAPKHADPRHTLPGRTGPGTVPRTTPPTRTRTQQPPAQPTQAPSTQPAQPNQPAPTAPAHAQPAGPGDRNGRGPAATSTQGSSADLPMVAFAGGVLLAGVSLTALIGYRRRQFRQRHPGNTITSCAPGLLRVERTLLSVGGPAMVDITWLDQVLRGLVHGMDGEDGELAGRLPDVVAARLSRDELELVLASAQPNAPAPWTVDETGTRWSIPRGEDCEYDPAQRAYHFAPFPTLTSVGYAADGSQWLLDLERVASMSLAGDPERCLNLARFVACELAHNTWSEMLQVTLVGFGRELAEINPNRLTYTEDFDAAIAELADQVEAVSDTVRQTGLCVLAARTGTSSGDGWAPHVLLIAPTAARDRDGLERLLSTMREQHSRMAVAVVLSDDPDHADATTWQLSVDEDGTLHIPALGLELTAQQIPADEAAELAQRLAMAATTTDRPMPPAEGQHPWDRFADAAGALRMPTENLPAPEFDPANADGDAAGRHNVAGTAPSSNGWAHAADLPALHLAEASRWMNSSVLPLPRETYLERAATTAEDLDALAPETNDEIRETVESTVGELDADLAEWYDESSVRPRVSVLGPVRVRAQGSLQPRNPRTQWHTEIVAYLATRPGGVSSERYGSDLWPNDPDINGKSKVRQSVMIVRKWLGKNPGTGVEYLPAAVAPGYASYRIEDCLLDAELFRRLRLRGLARGKDGIEDLWAALRLVTGEPFSERRAEGYAWLAEMPLDHVYSAMIVDVAHTVATHHLGAAEPVRAAEAAQVALMAGSTEDVPLLDQVAACDAQDKRAEANAFVKRILANHDVEEEEELPPRTAEVLMRRQWIGNAS